MPVPISLSINNADDPYNFRSLLDDNVFKVSIEVPSYSTNPNFVKKITRMTNRFGVKNNCRLQCILQILNNHLVIDVVLVS